MPDHGGLRVDTGLADERCRYVFARPLPGLTTLGHAVSDPLTVLKLCAAPAVMQGWLPDRWALDGSAALMTRGSPMAPVSTPAGYRLQLTRDGATLKAEAIAPDGTCAASGFAVEHGGVFAFDRIVTAPPHRRRGLGAAIMALLSGTRADRASRFVLVATPEGRALYESIGWTVESPYTTARLR